MNASSKKIWLSVIAFTCVALITVSKISNADEKTLVPDGFEHMLVYMGTGIFDPNNPEPRPGVTGCVGGFCDGEYFQEAIMGRTSDEVALLEIQAKEFIMQRYGIYVDDPAMLGRTTFEMFTFNPDIQYRVHVAAGSEVPSEGWVIRDGGWKLEVVDPDGIDLGGEMLGVHADQGNLMFFGTYNILVTDTHGKIERELIIAYQSTTPAVISEDGSMAFRCEMTHEKWGKGQGFGNFTFIGLEDGTIRANGRNVLTFPPISTLSEFPAEPAFGDHQGAYDDPDEHASH